MTNWEPNKLARFGGFLYLLIIAISIYGELFVRASLIDVSDIETTTSNILRSLSLWKLALALDYLLIACGITLAYIYFSLFKHVNKNIIFLFLFFNLTAFVIESTSKINLLSIQLMLEQPINIDTSMLHANVQHALHLYSYNFNLGMMFIGFGYLVLGSLFIRSQMLPVILGRMIQLAGVCYVSNTFIQLLAYDVFLKASPFILMPAFIAEVSLCLWLLVFGVKTREVCSADEDSYEESLA